MPIELAKKILAFAPLGMILFVSCQASFVYYPSRALATDPEKAGIAYESIILQTDDGETIHGWWIPGRDNAGTVLFFHGNAGNISHRIDHIKMFHRIGVNVLMVDYRGFGKSSGTPTEQGTYRDALASWRFLTDVKGVPVGRIVVMGQSLGGAIAAWLAREKRPGALILDSSFTTIADVASQSCLYYPIGWLMLTYRYDTIGYLRSVQCPVMIIHSREDGLIPFLQGDRLFVAAQEPKRMLAISGSHNLGFLESMSIYEPGIKSFIEKFIR